MSQHPAKPPRLEIIISIEHADPWRSAGVDGEVAGARRTAIALERNEAKPAAAIVGGLGGAKSCPVIIRCIVNHDHFGRLFLGEGRGDSLADISRSAPGGDDDGD